MASRGYFRSGVASIDSSDSDDDGEEFSKPKHTGDVTRIYDQNKSSFQRIRNRPKKTSVMSLSMVVSDAQARNQRLSREHKKNGGSKNGTPARINNLFTPKSSKRSKPTEGAKGTPNVKIKRNETPNTHTTLKHGIGVTPKSANNSHNYKKNSHKRKHTLDNTNETEDFTPKHKRRKLNVQNKSPGNVSSSKQWKNVKTPVNSNKNPRYVKLPDVKRNQFGIPINNHTPEYKRIKEEDSEKQIRKERKTRRNIIMKMRTHRGQPVMRGRIELMLEKIKQDLSTTG